MMLFLPSPTMCSGKKWLILSIWTDSCSPPNPQEREAVIFISLPIRIAWGGKKMRSEIQTQKTNNIYIADIYSSQMITEEASWYVHGVETTLKARGTLSPKPSQKPQINVFLSWATIKEAPLHSISKLICVKAKNSNQPQPTHAKTLTNIQPAPVPVAAGTVANFSVEWLGARLLSWCFLLGLEMSSSSLLLHSGTKEEYFPFPLPTPFLIV